MHRYLPLVKRAKAGHASTRELVYEKVKKTQEQKENIKMMKWKSYEKDFKIKNSNNLTFVHLRKILCANIDC